MAPNPDHRLCIDRVVPDHYAPARAETRRALDEAARIGLLSDGSIDASGVIAPSRLAQITLKKWATGTALRCRFLDGSEKQRATVEDKAKIWEKYAGISFAFGEDPDAEIRISFSADAGSWSAVGTDCLIEDYFPKYQPTMNFGWLRDDTDDIEYERVTVHEFGHALGCIHEHQAPGASLRWNKPEVYRVFGGAPNFWSKEQIDHNILDRYSRTQTRYSVFDRASIMLYAFPASLFLDGTGTPSNTHLSETDKTFIGTLYPQH
jgi:hypothetical protein